MTEAHAPEAGNTPGYKIKLQLIFYILALAATVVILLIFRVGSLLENSEKLASGKIYVAASAWDIPVLLSLPTFIALIFAMLLKLLNKATDTRIQASVKVALIFAFIAIAVRIPYGLLLSKHLESHGYSRCVPYTAPAMMSATVWVRDSRYCIENSGSVRRSLLAWLDKTQLENKYLSPADVKVKVNSLLEEFDKRERERYPELYD
ncbi:hypothetical protein P886_0493 [Alteromonadaceae bacterium 2753L.S.0a.02]|nr:hypothetical protein P886_0493 [Alteromonadaceae bacterium 2753L.S.0a.02]